MKKNNFKESLFKICTFIINMIPFLVTGFYIGFASIQLKKNIKESIIVMIILYIIALISFMFHIIIHEAGHLIFGLLSGYKFVSFRIGSLTLIKENGKLSLKKFSIPGTAGQCLMMPPEGKEYDCPYFLYNLGGILLNVIVSIIFLIISFVFTLPKFIEIIFILSSLLGFSVFLTNGIPLKVGGVANDGYNLISLGKDKLARKAFYIQLYANALLYNGVRPKDMPIEWFYLPEDADFNNSLISSIKLIEGSYYYDRHEFEKAKSCYENLLNKSPKMMEFYKNEINCELLFFEIMGECNREKINNLYSKKLKKYIKTTLPYYITKQRLMYAYTLIYEKDKEKAKNYLLSFNKLVKTYPAKGEIESEKEIIKLIEEKGK